MGGRSISGYVDETVAERVAFLARAEDRTAASLVGQAVGFYTTLSETARIALRRIDQIGSDEERKWFAAELTRLLIRTDLAVTQRKMAGEMDAAVPRVGSEKEIEARAMEWTHPVAR